MLEVLGAGRGEAGQAGGTVISYIEFICMVIEFILCLFSLFYVY